MGGARGRFARSNLVGMRMVVLSFQGRGMGLTLCLVGSREAFLKRGEVILNQNTETLRNPPLSCSPIAAALAMTHGLFARIFFPCFQNAQAATQYRVATPAIILTAGLLPREHFRCE